MNLPCRHLFKFREQNELDLFSPELCASRWTKLYYNQSHPALQMNENIPATVPMYIRSIRVPEEKDKYKAAASVTKDINSLVSTMATGEFTFYLEKLKHLKDQITAPAISNDVDGENEDLHQGAVNLSVPHNGGNHIVDQQIEEVNSFQSNTTIDGSVLDLSLPKAGSNSNIRVQISSEMDLCLPNSSRSTTSHLNTNVLQVDTGESPRSLNGSTHSSQLNENVSPQMHSILSQSRLVVVASTKSEASKEIVLPYKRVSAGRPKGAVNNVIGTKAKRKKTSSTKSKRNKMISPVQLSDNVVQLSNNVQPKRSERIRNRKLKKN